MKFLYISTILLLFINPSNGQKNSIDGLVKDISLNKVDSFFYELARKTYLDDPNLAIEYAGKCFEEATTYENHILQIKSQFLIGYVSNSVKNWSEAKRSLELSIELAKKYNRRDRFTASYFELGILYMNTYQYDLAIENYFEAIKYSEEFENHRYKIAAYNQIGLVYLRLEKFEEALSNFQTSLELRESFGIESGIV